MVYKHLFDTNTIWVPKTQKLTNTHILLVSIECDILIIDAQLV